MRPGRASFTAQVVSFARGLASLSSPAAATLDDSLARVLLPAPLSTALTAAALSGRGARLMRRSVDLASGNLIEHMALRTLAIDDAVRESVALGAKQLVLLGAGLDTRAHRLDVARELTVFEVDHPDTQREKRRRIAGHAPSARALHYVPVDFSRDSLEAALAAAGHDVNAPTCWIWEGVTMYLPKPAMLATLAALSRRSAPTSRLLVTYIDVAAFGGPSAVSRVAQAMFRVLGEPLLGLYEVDEFAGALAASSFKLCSDTTTSDWRRRHGVSAPLLRVFDGERLAIAERSRVDG